MVQASMELPERIGRLAGPVRTVLEAVFVVCIAILIGRLAWLAIAPEHSVAALVERPLPAPVMDTSTVLEADRARLVQFNPFGTQVTASLEPTVEAPETTLNLRLIGLFMSTGEELSSAQIVTPDNRAQRFETGDEILPGVLVERILSDRVILRRNGENEALLRDGRSETLTVITDGSQVTSRLPDEARPERSANERPVNAEDDLIRGKVADPAVFVRAVSLSPVERDGAVYAFNIQGMSGAALAGTGLQSGDLVREVNGRSVAQLTQGDFVDAVIEGDSVTLEIERDGTPRRVRLDIGE